MNILILVRILKIDDNFFRNFARILMIQDMKKYFDKIVKKKNKERCEFKSPTT